MIKPSPRLKELLEGKTSPFRSRDTSRDSATYHSAERKPLFCSPRVYHSPMDQRVKHSAESCLGKRSSGSKQYHNSQERKENTSIQGSATKTRQERLLELDQRYKALNEKLSAQKEGKMTPASKVQSEVSMVRSSPLVESKSLELQQAYQFNPLKVLVVQQDTTLSTSDKEKSINSKISASPIRFDSLRKDSTGSINSKMSQEPIVIDLESPPATPNISKTPLKPLQTPAKLSTSNTQEKESAQVEKTPQPSLESVKTEQPMPVQQAPVIPQPTPLNLILPTPTMPQSALPKTQQLQPPRRFLPDPTTKLAYRSYAARTNNGLFRDYNEDRVSIIQKIYMDSTQDFPVSFFALFDGHSGVTCADYLRDNLHQIITKQSCYRKDKKKALSLGILEAEDKFLAMARTSMDNSGSCAVIALFERDRAYFANVGDSRAVISRSRGKISEQVTNDHKPESSSEKARIFSAGGGIFRSKKCVFREVTDAKEKTTEIVEDTKYGPFRVSPGGLSVSRTIGDYNAKDPTRGGNPQCIIPTPEVFDLELTSEVDFTVIACDGIFDVLSTKEVVDGAWEFLNKYTKSKGLKESCRLASEYIMKLAFDKRSMDNVTVIIVAFQPEEYYH